MPDNKTKEIDIMELLQLIWKKRILVVLLALLAAAATFLSVYYSTPLYESGGVLYVSNRDLGQMTPTLSDGKTSTSDINASRSLVTSYLEVLKTDDFLLKVAAELNNDPNNHYTPAKLRSMITMSALNETELLYVQAISPDPNVSYEVVSAVLKYAPDTLIYVFDSGSAKIIDTPKISKNPINNNIVRKTVIGFFVGACLGCVIIFLLHFFDQKIHKSSDLVKRYELSVLGEIRR